MTILPLIHNWQNILSKQGFQIGDKVTHYFLFLLCSEPYSDTFMDEIYEMYSAYVLIHGEKNYWVVRNAEFTRSKHLEMYSYQSIREGL